MRLVLLRKGSSLLLALWWCMTAPVCSSDITTTLKSSSGYRSRWCGDVDTDSTLTLTCPPHTWFHVQQKITSEDSVSSCCSSEYPSANRAIPSSSSAPPLVTDCRGPTWSVDDDPQTCQESIQVHRDLDPSQIQFVEIAYECIDESVQYNLCQPLTLTGITGDFYLASPSFYSPTIDDVHMPHNATCHCTLTSDKFSVHALYLSQADGWNMTCPTCKSRFQQKYELYPAVNEVLFIADLQNDSRHVLDVEFQPCCHAGSADNELWIHITDNVYVIVGAVGFSVGLTSIIIMIVVIVVTIRRRRPQQSETVPRSRDSSSTAEYHIGSRDGLSIHEYAGLDLSANNIDDRMPPNLADRQFPRDGQGMGAGRTNTEEHSQGSSPAGANYLTPIPCPEDRTREQPEDSEENYYSEIRETGESVPGT